MGLDFLMARYYQTHVRETFCEVCGELTMCDVFAAEYPEQETGYLVELALPRVLAGTGARQ